MGAGKGSTALPLALVAALLAGAAPGPLPAGPAPTADAGAGSALTFEELRTLLAQISWRSIDTERSAPGSRLLTVRERLAPLLSQALALLKAEREQAELHPESVQGADRVRSWCETARSFAAVVGGGALPLLIPAARSSNGEVASAAREAIGLTGDQAGLPVLMEILHGWNTDPPAARRPSQPVRSQPRSSSPAGSAS